jgi:mono/diheme cytochrome c family protein
MSNDSSSSTGDQKPLPRLEHAGASDTDLEKVHSSLAREKSEPTEGFSPIPLLIVFLFPCLFVWAGMYLERYSATWDPLVYDFRFSGAKSGAGAAPQLTPDSPEWVRRGQRIYQSNCQACHGANGQGVPGVFPPLADSEWVIGPESDYLLPRVLLYGLVGPIEVRGNPYNGNMPAQFSYTDAQIAQVLSFIRREWGNQGDIVTAEQIAEVRALYGRRGPFTDAELREGLATRNE